MKPIAVAARLVLAASVVMVAQPMKAGAAGVYENASAEPAFLLAPRRATLRGDMDFSRNEPTEASVYRAGATFPLRGAMMVGVEQTLVSVSNDNEIKSGIGDLYIRGSARVWKTTGRAVSLLGFLGTGTTKQEYFPYSSKTLDLSASVAYTDTLETVSLYATAGRTWVARQDQERPVDERNTDYWRGSAGVVWDMSGPVAAFGGALYEYSTDHTTRLIMYAGAGVLATDELMVRANVQFELGNEAQRVTDIGGSVGVTVRL
ncbi:MAG TPA: hypothetical protein VFH88_11975 [Candidatus Krumholzibacteria bacterium]|nr:hypothetical protein [Candidatus Krumholzibacteria bacterium]